MNGWPRRGNLPSHTSWLQWCSMPSQTDQQNRLYHCQEAKKKTHIKYKAEEEEKLKLNIKAWTRNKLSSSYTLSLISSSRFISFLANCCLRYSGATLTAVTWPCHDSPCPSTFPMTAMANHRKTNNFKQHEIKVHKIPIFWKN